MFSTGRLSFKVPYPFTWFFTKKIPHYRESPGMGTHKHTRHSYLNSSISQCKNKKIKKIVLTQYRGHHGHHWQSSRGTWLRSSQRMFYGCRGSEILALVLPYFYWNRIKLCVVARRTGLFARCCLFCIWCFFTLPNSYESPSLAQLPRGESK